MAYSFHPDVIILDIIMPGMDGLQVCEQLRVMTDAVILFVTVRGHTEDVIRGLRAGADDYIIKPYPYRELMARMKACLRRRSEGRSSSLRLENKEAMLSADPSRRLVFLNDGRSVQLTPTEFSLLEYLIRNRGRVLSADAILANVWGPGYTGEHQLVKQFIYRLRTKLEPDPSDPEYILTIRGSGYTLEEDTRPSGGKLKDATKSSGSDPAGFHPSVSGSAPSARSPRSIQKIDLQELGRVRSRPWSGRFALAVLLAMIFSLGLSYVAGFALPGDALYPVKTGMEDVRLFLTRDHIQEQRMLVHFAQLRLQEADLLLTRRRHQELPRTLTAYETLVDQAAGILMHIKEQEDPQVDTLESMLGSSLTWQAQQLAELLVRAPQDYQPFFNQVLEDVEGHALLIHGASTPTPSVPALTPQASSNPESIHNQEAASGTRAADPSVNGSPSGVDSNGEHQDRERMIREKTGTPFVLPPPASTTSSKPHTP
jgi:DNA-binding response OmpR family regulator